MTALACAGCGAGVLPSKAAPQATLTRAADLDGISIKARALPIDPAFPRVRVLVSLMNQTGRELVLSTGDANTDWLRGHAFDLDGSGEGAGSAVSDEAREGDKICPVPQFTLSVASGSTIARIQEVDRPPAGSTPRGLVVRLHVVSLPSSFACGPAHIIDRSVDVVL